MSDDQTTSEKKQATKPEDKKTAPADYKMFVKVYAPFRVYYEDYADSVSALNDTGPFDILPQHHKFLTLLNPCDVIVRKKGKEDSKIKINRGIMFVQENKVMVFLDV